MRIAVNFKVWFDNNKIALLVCYPFKNDGEPGKRMEQPSLFSKEERKRLDKFTEDLISIVDIQTQHKVPMYSPGNKAKLTMKWVETDVIDYLEDNGFTISFIDEYDYLVENIFVLDTEKEQNDFLNKIKEYIELNKKNKTNEMKHIKLFENFKHTMVSESLSIFDKDNDTEIFPNKFKELVDNTSQLKVELEDDSTGQYGVFDNHKVARLIGYSIRTSNFESFKLLLDHFEPDSFFTIERLISTYVLGASITAVKSESYDVSESDLEKFIDYVGKKGYISEVSDEKYDRFLDFATHGSRVEKVRNLIDLIESYR